MFKYLFPFIFILAGCTSQTVVSVATVPMESHFITFEASHGFEIFYDSGATKTIQEYYETGSVVLNGSYFGWTTSGEYYPAWLWIEHHILQHPIEQHDANISHMVFYRDYGNSISIIPNSESKLEIPRCLDNRAGCIAFQAWPLVLSGNILQDFGFSWHANEPHERTLIWKTQSGKIFFFISTTPITLRDAGDIILKDSRFTIDPITVLNLDGWPSTAFFDGVDWFRRDKKLPIIFRIKKSH